MSAKRWILAVCAAALLAACSPGSEPELIGSYPRAGNAHPRTEVVVVYSTRLALEVADVPGSVQQAADYAVSYGGYMVEAQTWNDLGRPRALVTLAVPAPNFEGLRQTVLGLGTLISETLSGEPRPISRSDWNTYTHIILELHSGRPSVTLPRLTVRGWDPGRTLSQAFDVTFRIFAFVVDVLIWVVVVLGPFALLGWGARALWRRLRR